MLPPVRILHLSDLHFGRIDAHILDRLENYLSTQSFHLTILTGDLTQRARKEQFIAAKEFLGKLKCPMFIVPGNHDVPLYNLFLRFFSPYSKFKRFFGTQSPQFFEDDRLAVFGLWTVNPRKVEKGTVNISEILTLEEKFNAVPADKIKILAFHHPLVTMKSARVQDALARIKRLKPQILMWGHDHQSGADFWNEADGTGPILIAAGTSVSNRTRSETNSFNVIELSQNEIKVETISFDLDNKTFHLTNTKAFDIAKTRA